MLNTMLPLVLFYTGYKIHNNNTIIAIIYLLLSTLVLSIYNLIRNKKNSRIIIIYAVVLSIFGLLSVITNNTLFIKMRSTVVYGFLSGLLLWGFLSNRPILKSIFTKIKHLDNQTLHNLSIQWSVFFLIAAILNELVWRFTNDDFWMKFKVFIMPTITFIFSITQMLLITRKKKNEESKRIRI